VGGRVSTKQSVRNEPPGPDQSSHQGGRYSAWLVPAYFQFQEILVRAKEIVKAKGYFGIGLSRQERLHVVDVASMSVSQLP